MRTMRIAAPAVAAVLAILPTAVSPGHALSGPEAIERAQSWVDAGVGYQAGGTYSNQYGTYRTDCSGFVSMALGLPTSYTTGTLESVSYAIAKDGLEPGDIINNPAEGASGHVVLFAGWADDARTRYIAYEESPSGGAHVSEIPYPYWPGYGTFTPRRYTGIRVESPEPIPAPEPIKQSKPERVELPPLVDSNFVRHDGQVYRLAGGAPIVVTSWKNVGGRQKARKLTDAEFAALATQPTDGTFLRTPKAPMGRGEVYVVAGGAPVLVPRGSLDVPRDVVVVDQAAIDGSAPTQLNRQPADGTVVKTERSEYYVFAGGAPIHMTDEWRKSLRPRPKATTVPQISLDLAGGLGAWSHVRNYPADDTLIKTGATVYRIVEGRPVLHTGVRGVQVDPAAIDNAGLEGPWSHLVADEEPAGAQGSGTTPAA